LSRNRWLRQSRIRKIGGMKVKLLSKRQRYIERAAEIKSEGRVAR
jgi:chorismate mutase